MGCFLAAEEFKKGDSESAQMYLDDNTGFHRCRVCNKVMHNLCFQYYFDNHPDYEAGGAFWCHAHQPRNVQARIDEGQGGRGVVVAGAGWWGGAAGAGVVGVGAGAGAEGGGAAEPIDNG